MREQSLNEQSGNLIVPKKHSASAKSDGGSVKARLTSLMSRSFGAYAKVNVDSSNQTHSTADGAGCEQECQDSKAKSFKTMERIEDIEEDDDNELSSNVELAAVRKKVGRDVAVTPFQAIDSSGSLHSARSGRGISGPSSDDGKVGVFHQQNSQHGSQRSGRSRANSDDRGSPDEASKNRTLSSEQAALLLEATNKLYSSPHSSKPASARNSFSKSPAPSETKSAHETPIQNIRKGNLRFRSETDGDGSVCSHHSNENAASTVPSQPGAVGSSSSRYVQFEDDVLYLTVDTPGVPKSRKGMEPHSESRSRLNSAANNNNDMMSVTEDLELTEFTNVQRMNRWSVSDMDEAQFPKSRTWSDTADNSTRVEPFAPSNRKTIF
jgi:hypothetical protein